MSEIPKFSDEAEEAAWWYENRQARTDDHMRTFLEGRVKPGRHAKTRTDVGHVVLMSLEDEELATSLAVAEGIPVQLFLTKLVHEDLNRRISAADTHDLSSAA